MVVDVIFDSLCRCFGAPDSSQSPQQQQQQQQQQDDSHSSSARRVGRVQLKDKQFDALFVPQQQKKKQVGFSNNSNTRQQQQQRSHDVDQAHELAKAKLASAYPKKRKSPASKRDEIFRTRDYPPREKPEPPSNSFSRFLSSHQGNLVNALCFATPIDEEDDDDDEVNEILKTDSDDDCNTLNTAEDTVTSTLFFESKYAHIVEHRPPMPLFSDFKVEDDQNELRRIVASDSHNSLKMIRLSKSVPSSGKVELEESEEEEDDDMAVASHDDDVPPAIKIDSSGSSSTSSRR